MKIDGAHLNVLADVIYELWWLIMTEMWYEDKGSHLLNALKLLQIKVSGKNVHPLLSNIRTFYGMSGASYVEY